MLKFFYHIKYGNLPACFKKTGALYKLFKKRYKAMGQNECCAEKEFTNNAEYAPNVGFKNNKYVPRKVAVDVLAPIVKKKMQ